MKRLKLNVVRIVRGGNWVTYSSILRTVGRYGSSPSAQISSFGPRLVRGKR